MNIIQKHQSSNETFEDILSTTTTYAKLKENLFTLDFDCNFAYYFKVLRNVHQELSEGACYGHSKFWLLKILNNQEKQFQDVANIHESAKQAIALQCNHLAKFAYYEACEDAYINMRKSIKKISHTHNIPYSSTQITSHKIEGKSTFESWKIKITVAIKKLRKSARHLLDTEKKNSALKELNKIEKKVAHMFPSKIKWRQFKTNIKANINNGFIGSTRGEKLISRNGNAILERIRVFSKCNDRVTFQITQTYKTTKHAFLIQKDGTQFTLYDVNHEPKQIKTMQNFTDVLVNKNCTTREIIQKTSIVPFFPKEK